MTIIACGINHKTAAIDLREKVVFQTEQLSLYLQDLIHHENISEAVLLSTCNRSEIYCVSSHPEKIKEWFCRQHQIEISEIRPAWYCLQGQKAVAHIMQVACGLDSMVLGEPEILGQMKQAFSESCAAGIIGAQFNRLFQQVFAVAKEVRTNTAIGACPVSIASTTVNLAKQVFERPWQEAKVLLIGAGDTIQLVLRYLQNKPVKSLYIANRHIENAAALAEKFFAKSISFAELPRVLAEVDVVISATGSSVPIIQHAMLANINKSIIILDIAVPRDVEARVRELSQVKLYCIDDLKNMIQSNLHGREHAAEKAQQIISEKSQEFIVWLQALDQVGATIRVYRKQIEDLCAIELNRAMRQLQQGDDPIKVLASFAHALTNKLLHNPSVQLRQAGIEGRFDMLQLAKQLLILPEPERI